MPSFLRPSASVFPSHGSKPSLWSVFHHGPVFVRWLPGTSPVPPEVPHEYGGGYADGYVMAARNCRAVPNSIRRMIIHVISAWAVM